MEGDSGNYTEGGSALATAKHAEVLADVVTMPTRPMRADAVRNYDKVLSAATAAFAEHGPDATLDDIAKRAGVGIGTLYRHFPTRESLQGAVVRERIVELAERGRELLDDEAPFDALVDWLHEHLAFSATKRGMLAAVLLMKDSGDPDFVGACDRMIGVVDALVARAEAAGELRPGVSGNDVLQLVSGIAYSAERSGDPALADRLFSLMIAGIRAEPAATGLSARQ